ncbi:MAG: hypothetical protein AB7P17_12765 [Nitrospirales bacterium]|nr:hypothetical protein [Nitrospirales bacterium]
MAHPWYLGVVFWGTEFRNDFLDFCLSSLLAPGNIPAITEKADCRFLFCTTRADWEAMQNQPSFHLLGQHLQPVWLELSPVDPQETKMQMMSRGHRMIADVMYRRKVWGTYVYPDTVFADGVLSRLQELGLQGKKIVLAHCPRFANQGFLHALRTAGLIQSGLPLSLSGGRLMTMAMPHMHSETRSYQWDAPYFRAEFPALIWWPVSGGGLLCHTTAWAPLLIDYGRIERHDTWTLENWTIDGDYVFRNIHSLDEVHAETDPDAMTLISFTDETRHSYLPLLPRPVVRLPGLGTWYRKLCLRNLLHSAEIDPLKRKLFLVPIYVPGEAPSSNLEKIRTESSQILNESSRPLSSMESRIMYWLRVVNEGIFLHAGFWIANRPQLLRMMPEPVREKITGKNT